MIMLVCKAIFRAVLSENVSRPRSSGVYVDNAPSVIFNSTPFGAANVE